MLEKNPLITINSHGHNHQNLKILNDEEVKYEITKSLEVLENLINRKVKHFAYPFGGKDQVSAREYNIIEDLLSTGTAWWIKELHVEFHNRRFKKDRRADEVRLIGELFQRGVVCYPHY